MRYGIIPALNTLIATFVFCVFGMGLVIAVIMKTCGTCTGFGRGIQDDM